MEQEHKTNENDYGKVREIRREVTTRQQIYAKSAIKHFSEDTKFIIITRKQIKELGITNYNTHKYVVIIQKKTREKKEE